MRTVEEHLDAVLAATRPLDTVVVPIERSGGRTLAAPLLAAVSIPVFDNSAMDGFAVRRADVETASETSPVRLRVVADIPAGSGLDPALAPGDAARIMTGAPVPSGADAIVPVEDTAEGFGRGAQAREITILRAPRVAAHIRRRGEDATAGAELLPAGEPMGPLQIAAAAAAGVASLAVTRAPRVSIVSTGSELVPPGSALERGQIPESNSLLLAALALEAGAEVVSRETVPDEPAALRRAIERASERAADAVIMTGGVSEGAYEPVRQALGGRMAFGKVAMQPGKPQGFGTTADGMLLFGFPGNPVSAAVSFECFARPALLAMQGRRVTERPRIRIPAAVAWRSPRARRQYLPAAIDRGDPARWTVRPATAGGSGSHLAGGLARAAAYAVVPAEVDEVAPGDPVDVMLIA